MKVTESWEGKGQKNCWVLLLIVGIALVLRFEGLGDLALIGDESYYWLWSRYPAWAYYDHPAGVALMVRVSTALAGGSEFGVRWLNALLGAGAALLTGVVGRRLLSHEAGWFGAAVVAVGAPYVVTSRFVYTDVLLLVLLLCNLLTFWRLTREDVGFTEALSFGLSLALLLNTKYSAYFYVVALFIVVLVDYRPLLRTRWFWVGGGIGAAGLVPVFAWNAAHGWVSFRWQLSHATLTLSETASLLGSAYHAWVYLTWPIVVLGLLGLGRWRAPAERLLTLVAVCLLGPVALSPANSPRNLSTGMVPLLLLAGTRLPLALDGWARRTLAVALGGILLVAVLYGVGTVSNLAGSSPLPHSSIVPAILRDASGWSMMGAMLIKRPGPFFALDYSIAAQIRYYTGQPTTTAWGQYRIWGIPGLECATIVALDYLPPDWVTQRLREAFDRVAEPERLTFTECGVTKVVYLWRAEGLQWAQSVFLQRFDFLTLVRDAP